MWTYRVVESLQIVKTAYGLARVMVHLRETAYCIIGVALLLLNLTKSLAKSLRATLCLFCLQITAVFSAVAE